MKIEIQKEKPILFSTMMVRQILDHKKTHTRRLMNPQPIMENGLWRWIKKDFDINLTDNPDLASLYSPYKVGEKLWIKETWCILAGDDENGDPILYKANYNDEAYLDELKNMGAKVSWHSGRFMFKKFARIWRDVVSVKPQRLSDMTDEDAMDEGMNEKVASYIGLSLGELTKDCGFYYLHIFRHYWDFLNEKNGHPFSKSEWVWDYGFKELELKS
jgi:hypothetical protein